MFWVITGGGTGYGVFADLEKERSKFKEFRAAFSSDPIQIKSGKSGMIKKKSPWFRNLEYLRNLSLLLWLMLRLV